MLKNKIVYFSTKEAYLLKCHEIAQTCIVLIEETKEVITQGGYIVTNIDALKKEGSSYKIQPYKGLEDGSEVSIEFDDSTKTVHLKASEILINGTNLEDALNSKVSTEEGKGLSTNDYTNEDKAKLDSLSTDGGGSNMVTEYDFGDLRGDEQLSNLMGEMLNAVDLGVTEVYGTGETWGVSGGLESAKVYVRIFPEAHSNATDAEITIAVGDSDTNIIHKILYTNRFSEESLCCGIISHDIYFYNFTTNFDLNTIKTFCYSLASNVNYHVAFATIHIHGNCYSNTEDPYKAIVTYVSPNFESIVIHIEGIAYGSSITTINSTHQYTNDEWQD